MGFRKIRGSAIDARCKSAGTFPGRNRNTEKIVQYVERKKQNKELKIYDSDHLEEKKVMLLYETFLNKLTNTVYAKNLEHRQRH